eukprot:NODE_2070_length_660_cov_28.191370_g2020_i0.p1 GENE.NODE_2070_length_660_cov_28.191370_g2020_i0~~NODE_2070_length_660_cov_28.191370_g2020_i0.p1  ORF type:complete len:198 (+),score=36.83 NODE_2070_length_660_cov_28.191370_g2020_i0:65-658(+)
MLRIFQAGQIAQNISKFGPGCVSGLSRFAQDYNDVKKVKLDRDQGRAEREPLYQDTFASIAWRFTPHEANLFVDKEWNPDRQAFRKYRHFRKDALAAAPLAAPLLFGPYGLVATALAHGNEHWLPTAFTRRDGESFNQQMIRRYAEHTDNKRLKYGPQLHRLTMTLGSIQKGQIPSELVAQWRNLWWNHVDNPCTLR